MRRSQCFQQRRQALRMFPDDAYDLSKGLMMLTGVGNPNPENAGMTAMPRAEQLSCLPTYAAPAHWSLVM